MALKKKSRTWNRMDSCQGSIAGAMDRKLAGKRPYRGRGQPIPEDDSGELRVSIEDRQPKPEPVKETLTVAGVVERLLQKMGSMLFPDRVAWQSEADPHLFIGEGDGSVTVTLTDEELVVVQPVVKRWKGGDRKYLGLRALTKLAGC